jgi:hypothetical protein
VLLGPILPTFTDNKRKLSRKITEEIFNVKIHMYLFIALHKLAPII